jgi:hypothetical protein
MKTLQLLLIGLLLPLFTSGQVKKEELPTLLESKKFVFKATTAIPFADADLQQALRQLGNTGAGTVQLTGSVYELRVNPDSLVAYLPYFGRTYTSVVDREEMGIKFTSKKFSYKASEKKKGGWQILLGTEDVKDAYRLQLDISKSGYATLIVRDIYRQPITFYGYIESLPDK